jgi:hypothetical protein
MLRYHRTHSQKALAEVVKGSIVIESASDILDILGEVSFSGSSAVIIYSDSFSHEFYDLRSGVAGEILQKFSNYRIRLAIVGDFSHLTGKSWRDFIRESNRGMAISFLPTLEEALSVLTK